MKSTARLWLALVLFGLAPVAPLSAADGASRISERTYKRLSSVHQMMEKGRYEDALAGLNRLRPRVAHKDHEHALVLQTYGYVFTSTENYQQAVDALTRCLALDALPEAATRDTLYLVAQLQTAIADYRAAVATLEQWFRLQQDPTPDAHALAGTVYAQLKRYPQAVTHLRKAIALGAMPQENWYRQLLAVYYDGRQYQSAAALLRQMIGHFPDNRDYWLQLSSVYRELGDDTRSIAVMELAYVRGLLDREPDLVNLAKYYLYVELPHKAGQLLEKSLQQGALQPTHDNWRLLTNAWLQAKETDLALAATERALEFVQAADLQLRRAQLLTDKEQWADVVRSTELALAGEGLPSSGRAHLLQGIARYHLQQPLEAQASFERAKGFKDSRSQAEQWIRYLASDQRRAAQGRATAYLSH